MSRRLDIGMACYGKPQQLPRTIAALQQHSVTDWKLWLVVNPHPKHDMRELVSGLADRDPRIVPVWMESNVGYSGAINELFRRADTDRVAYVDDDAEVLTPGWDEALCQKLDIYHELGWVFPNEGPYMIDRGGYVECLWGVGFCWVLARQAMIDVGDFDTAIGHQNEVDYSTRLRLAGWKIACVPQVRVRHEATATNDPAQLDRINKGVVEWLNKWLARLVGKNVNYHSPNVLRFEDLHPTAIHMEQFWLQRFPDLNANPEVITVNGTEYDLIKVPRLKNFYRNRII